MSKEQDEMCYECYKAITKKADFSIKDSCHVYETYKELGEINCPHFMQIKIDERKAKRGDGCLGSGATIVRMMVERGDIEIPDMGVFKIK